MSATNRGCERKAYDFYATPPETVRAFLANFDGISAGDRILEPSAGNGQIVKVLREGGYDNRIDAVELLHPGGLLIFPLRTNFLESEKRFKWWQEHPLSGLYTLHKRPSFTGRGTDATSYSWFVWERGDRLHRSSDHQNHLRRTSAWKTLT